MRKRLLCSVRYDLDIVVKGPLLIKSGTETLNEENMTPVLTFRDGQQQPYIPGTSLKGVLRSHIERIARSLANTEVPVCLPYLQDAHAPECSCGERFKNEKDKKRVYRDSCLACRLFGSLQFRGRTLFSDAYATGKVKTEVRDGVAIDRKTGGAAGGAKYNLRVVTDGTFRTSISIENFEAWQLGMMTLALRDMEAQRLPLGLGTSRGLGQVEGKLRSIELRYPFGKVSGHIQGIGALATSEEKKDYKLFAASSKDNILPKADMDGLWDVFSFGEKASKDKLLQWSRQALADFLKEYDWDGKSTGRG